MCALTPPTPGTAPRPSTACEAIAVILGSEVPGGVSTRTTTVRSSRAGVNEGCTNGTATRPTRAIEPATTSAGTVRVTTLGTRASTRRLSHPEGRCFGAPPDSSIRHSAGVSSSATTNETETARR